MNKWTIYKKNGRERLAEIEESLQPNAGRFVEPQLGYNGTWMGECFVTLNIKSPVPIDFAIGDYVMYRGEKFVINYDPSVIKKATKKSTGDAFCYDNVKFSALSYELSDIRMLDFVIDGNNLHWNGLPRFSVFCPSIEEFADRLQANTDRWCHENGIGPTEKWFFITPTRNLSVARAASGEVSSSDKATASDTATSIYVTAFDQGTDVDDAMVNQNVSIDNMTVWDAMKYIKETFGLNFIVRGRAVIIGAAGIPVDGIFQYGKDNGLYEIERVADSEQQIITKLFAYGTDKNLPTRYYADVDGGNVPNNLAVNALMLPGFPSESLYHWVSNDSHCTASNDTTKQATWKGYTAIFSDNKYQPYIQSINSVDRVVSGNTIPGLGIREATKYFDGSDGTEEVYPTIENTGYDEISGVDLIEDNGVFDAGVEVPNFHITLRLPAAFYDFDSRITSESAIAMKSGFCGGREFHIVSATDAGNGDWDCECQRVHDESLDIWFPYSDGVAHGELPSYSEPYQIQSGDKYVLIGIELPDFYVEAASERLLEGALQFLAKNDTTRYTYVPKVDEIYMAREAVDADENERIPIHDKIKEGDLLMFEDTDLGISTNAVFIDTLRIKEYGNQQIPTYEVTLRNEKQVGTIQRIQEQIGKITSGETSIGGGTGGSVNIPLVKSLIQTYGTDLFLRKDKESTAAEIIRFLKGIRFGSSNQWYINGDGEAVLNSLNVENLTAKIAHFFQLEIDEIKSVGGMIVISPANATVYRVVTRTTSGIGTLPSGWYARTSRLYFRATDGDKKIFQSFMVGDQILCQTFNAANGTSYDVSNKYYWSVVTAVSSEVSTYSGEECHWIDVWGNTPGTNYAVQIGQRRGNYSCSEGDEIVLLGNRSNTARQNAIVISAYDIDWLDTGYGNPQDSDYIPKLKAPFIVQYAGINNFTLYNKRVNVISHGYNVFKGDFKANTGEDLMEVISQIEEGRLSFVHQAWAANAVEKADHGWILTDWNLNYFNGARFMCLLSDHTQGEAHLNDKSIWESAPAPNANPPVPKKNWVPFNYDISSVDYYYAKTTTGNKPADGAFSSSYPSDISANDYIWTKEVITYSNGLVSTSYSSLRIADDGAAGAEGVSSYLHIAYASSADGSQNFSTTPLASSTYIGFYRNEEQLDPSGPTAYTLYTWSKYVGDAGLNGLSAPPAYKETTVPHYLVYASGTGVTKNTSGWVDNNAPALTDEKPYLWRYDTTTYENVGGVQNLLLDSTNQFNYYEQNGDYIAKIKLAENLVNGNTYSLVFRADDLSQFSITSCTVGIYLTTAWMAPGKSSSSRLIGQATGVTQEADGTCRVTFTAIAPDSTNKQLALYISGVGLSGGVPEVYWAMLAEGGVQYDWIAAPEDLKKETTPAVVATKGRGIGQIAEYYAKNNSNTTPPSGWQASPYTGWSTTPVAADATNKYVWNFEVITYTDGTTVVTTPHVSSGYALGISNKTVTYAVTTSTSQPQDSAFTATTVPTVNKGEYLWTKTEITYGDNSVTKAYSVSYKATDGTSPYFADIDNEMDSVQCTSSGVTTAAFDKTLNVKMWHGSSEIALTTLSTNTISGITITANKTAKTVRVQVASGTTIAAVNNIVITIAGSGSGNMTLNFTLNGIRAGANGTNGTNGANAVIYNIVPEKDSINVARDGSAYVPANVSITCGYVKNDGGTATKVNDVSSRIDSKYNLYFRRRTRSNQAWETKYYLYNNGTTSYKSYLTSLAVATYDAVEFVLSTATAAQPATGSIGTVIDRETVPIVSDGEEGNGIKKVTVTYAGSTSGTTAPSSGWQSTVPSVALGNFLWTRSITEYTDTSVANTTSYSVSRIGADGANGTPGQPGADGRTPYFHTAYANSADGSVNFSTTYFTGASYIGTCTDYNEGDPSTYSSYEWAELRGMDNAGVYVTAVKNYYKVTNTNATPAIDNTWVLCPPGTIPQPTNTNRYLWNYEVTEYGCQYPNMVLNSDNPTIGGDPYLFRFNSTNEFVHGEVYSFAIKLGQLPSPKTYYALQIQGATYKDGTKTASSRAISQNVGQNPAYPIRLVPNEDGIISGTFECNLHFSDAEGDIDHEQHIWVSAYPEGGTYDVPSFDWITVVKGTQVASWSKALSELTQTIPPHLIATQGEKGDSAWVADLTNEMDSVQCDDTGYVVSSQSVSTALSLFYGVTEKNFGTPTVKRNGSTITIGTATNGVTVTYSNKVLTIAYTTEAKINGKDTFYIVMTASDDSTVVRTLTFTVNGVNGDVYNIFTKDQNINATRDASGNYLVNGSSTVPLTCGYTKNVNGTITVVENLETLDIDGKYRIFFRIRRRSDKKWQLYDSTKTPTTNYETGNPLYVRFYGANGIVDQNGMSHNQSTVNINTYDAVEFVITAGGYGNTQGWAPANIGAIDSETIYVVADGVNGTKGDFKSTVFKRQNTQPATPTGGTYDSPVPSGWSDGIPAGGQMVWASTRVFKGNGSATTWTTPRQMTDTMTYDVEFAYEQPQDATPVAPNEDNRSGGSGPQIWFDPAIDTDEDYTKMAWRAERECANGVWGDWTIIRIKGEEGGLGLSAPPELTRTVTPYWALSASNTTPPATTSSDWGTSPVAPTAEKKYVWYYTKATYTGEEASRNMLRNSKNQWSYTTRSSIYIAKIGLREYLVAGQTYTITFYVDDLSSLSTGNVTVRTLNNSTAYTKIQATIKVHEGNLYKATFTALSTTEATQVAVYIGVSNFTATSPETCPKVYWAMLTRGDVAYSWQAAPEDLAESSLPEIRTEKPDAGPQGPQGNAGRGIASGYPKEKYLLSNLNTGVTVAGNTWSNSILTPTEDKPYLWNYEETLWTDNTTTNSTPHILTTYTRAAAGDSYISGVYNWYVVTARSSGVTRAHPADGTWVKCPPEPTPVPTAQKRYLWNYEETVWDAPDQGRNLLVTKVANGRYTISSLPANGTTVTASVRLTVPSGKTHIKFALYGKNTSGTAAFTTQLDLAAETGALQTLTGTFSFNRAAYTDITEFRVYVTTGANTGMALAVAIEWVKLEKGALPTPYSEAPENLTTYTDPHVVCIHGEDGADSEVYMLSPIEEFAGIQFTQNGGINSTNRQLVVGLSYDILKVVGASYEEVSPSSDLYLRLKLTRRNGTSATVGHAFEDQSGDPSTIYTLTTAYTNVATSTNFYTVELVKAGNPVSILDTRVVYVTYIASAAFEIDQKLHEIRSIVQGSNFSYTGDLQTDLTEMRQTSTQISNIVQQHTTQLGEIPNTYATQSSVTQTASSIVSKVQNQMLNGANLLINSKEQTSGFNSSSSSAYDKTQTNTYYACYYFGADKPTAGDTFTVSWKQTNATGATKYRLYLFTDTTGVYLNPTAVNSNANGLYSVTVNLDENFPASVTKVALYVSSGTPSTLANVEWAKAEYGTTASAWNPNISETGSEISQTANNILIAVEDVGININDKQITLNGNTQVNGTLKLDGSGDGFQLLSNTGTALITPESIGTYTDFQQTNKVTINPNFAGVREYIRENGYYRMGMSTQTKELGTFDAGSQIEVTHCSAQIYLYQNGYPRLTGTLSGTISFYENNVLKETKTFPYTGTYTTQTTGDVKVLIDPVPTFFTVRQSGTGVPQAEADSYDLMDTAYYAGNPNALWMIYMTFRVPVPGAYVRVASDGVGVKTSNGNTAYFGPSGMHISPLLQNVTKVTTTNYSASVNDDVIIVKSSSSSAVSITLPTGGGIPEGKVIYVKNVGQASTCNVWAVGTSGSGSSSQRMYAHDSNTASPSVNIGRKMSFFISFDTGSGIGWLQGYCST